MGHWYEKLLLMVQKMGVIDFKLEKSKQKPKIKDKTHAEMYNRRIQKNQNSIDFMSR